MREWFSEYPLPLDDWVATFVGWLVDNFWGFFRAIRNPIADALSWTDSLLQGIEPLFIIALFVAVAYKAAGVRVALFTLAAWLVIGFTGMWNPAMTTLAMIIIAVALSAAIGIPLGIVAARSDRFDSLLRPGLDAMQTLPPFVYLVPIVMLFGIGNPPAVLATVIFAIPPVIRLTNLGIREVSPEVVEAAYAFGSTPGQVLREVQLPLALRTIMAGLNQTLMLALSMVVIAALIGARGLGEPVVRGLNRSDVGLAAIGGIAVVLLAIMLDRITQSFAGRRG